MAMEIEVAAVDYSIDTAFNPSEGAIAAGVDAAAMVNGDGVNDVPVQAVTPPHINQGGEQVEQVGTSPTAAATEESAASPTLDDPSPLPSSPQPHLTDEQREQAEKIYEAEIAEAKESHTALTLYRSEVELQLKELKADEKAALKSLQNLLKRGPAYPKPVSKIEEAVANCKTEKPAIEIDDPNADTTWRLIPTSEVIGEGIKGMGAKKLEAIIALAPTLGDMEELRAVAGKAHKQFKEVLPKGVGQAMADEIEERICVVMRKHQKQLEQAQLESKSQPEEVPVVAEVGIETVPTEQPAEQTQSLTEEVDAAISASMRRPTQPEMTIYTDVTDL